MRRCTAQEWFAELDRVTGGRWDRNTRPGPMYVTAFFSGYKPAEYHEAQDALLRLGGVVMAEDYDKIGGCTHVLIREPKCLDSRWFEPSPEEAV